MNIFKSLILMTAVSGALVFAGCNTNSNSGMKTTDTTAQNQASGHPETEAVYACPMHPEVTGKAGESCPKCGMKLVLQEKTATSGAPVYEMDFKTQPAVVHAGTAVTLILKPGIKGKANEKVSLEVEQTKKIHLIVVSDDLSYFTHIHPEEKGDGTYEVHTKFPAGGKYTLFADYNPVGGSHTINKIQVTVNGEPAAIKTFTTNQLTATTDDGFKLTLQPKGGKLETNAQTHLEGTLTQNGKPLDPVTLEDYLGAKAHMVIISLNDKEYLHVHPGVENGKFDLHTTFDKPGIYRGWIQFQSKGKLHTVDFVMNVKAGSGQPQAAHDMEHMDHQH